MSDTPLTFRLNFRLRSYEVEPSGHATELTLQNFLQEAAATHAHRLYFSIQRLFPMGLTWLLIKSRLLVERYPLWNETVLVETWPSGWSGAIAWRDFLILDERENPIAWATTHWMLFDFHRRRPALIEKHFPELPAVHRQSIERDIPNLPAVETPAYQTQFPVTWLNMDMNAHANNAAYIAWAMGAVPGDIRKQWVVKQMDVNFLKEVFAGDVVHSRVQVVEQTQNLAMHHELQKSDGKAVMRVSSIWRQRKGEEQFHYLQEEDDGQ